MILTCSYAKEKRLYLLTNRPNLPPPKTPLSTNFCEGLKNLFLSSSDKSSLDDDSETSTSHRVLFALHRFINLRNIIKTFCAGDLFTIWRGYKFIRAD